MIPPTDLNIAVQDFFQREAPEGYLEEWKKKIELEEDPLSHKQMPKGYLIFRLDNQWFGIPAQICKEILTPRKLHTVPFRSTPIFLGLVNVHGELIPCFSLTALFQLPLLEEKKTSFLRFLLIEGINAKGINECWGFYADEIAGVEPIGLNQKNITQIPLEKHKNLIEKMCTLHLDHPVVADSQKTCVAILHPENLYQEIQSHLSPPLANSPPS